MTTGAEHLGRLCVRVSLDFSRKRPGPKIGDHVCPEGQERNEKRNAHNERHIAIQSTLPGQLAETGRITENLNRNAGPNGHADGYAEQRNQGRGDIGHDMANKNSSSPQTARLSRENIWRFVTMGEKVADVAV